MYTTDAQTLVSGLCSARVARRVGSQTLFLKELQALLLRRLVTDGWLKLPPVLET
jgi:hypothetical protein